MLEKLKKIDWFVVVILAVLMAISTVVVHSATVNNPMFKNTDVKNVINYAVGFVVFFAAALFNYRLLVKGAPYLYAFGIALLVAVYLIGSETHQSRSWFELPYGFSFQPAELMKLLVIIAIAAYLERRGGEPLGFWRDIVPIGIIVLVPFVLVVIQPDLGNAIIFLAILIVMYWIGNIKYSHVLIGTALIVGAVVLFFFLFQKYYVPLTDYLEANNMDKWVRRLERIQTFIDPESVSFNAKYQVNNSIRAIGSGGLAGEGYMMGDSVQKGFVPYVYSDSIFVVIGEEFGFVGASSLLLIYYLLIYRMIHIPIQTQDRTGSYIIVGITSMFVFQVFENIGMLIGIMPLTGITLPFVSYGGTSLIINMMSLGLVTSIGIHQPKPSMY